MSNQSVEEVTWRKDKRPGKRRRRQKRKPKKLTRILNDRVIMALFIGGFCYVVVKVAIRLGS